MTEHYVEDRSLSVAWARALQLATAPGRVESTPLVVAITGFDSAGNFEEDGGIRTALDAVLATKAKQPVATVANTIFPLSLSGIPRLGAARCSSAINVSLHGCAARISTECTSKG